MNYTYYYLTPENDAIKRVDEDGTAVFFCVGAGNKDYDEFVASGAEAEPYVAPSEPEPETTEEKVNRLLSDYGLTREEMRAALDVKTSQEESK